MFPRRTFLASRVTSHTVVLERWKMSWPIRDHNSHLGFELLQKVYLSPNFDEFVLGRVDRALDFDEF